MSLLIESTAQFRARANEIGLTAPVRDALIASGLDTMSKLAFWVNQPGTSVDDTAITVAANGVVGGPVTVGDLAAIKRLHFESQAFTLQAVSACKLGCHPNCVEGSQQTHQEIQFVSTTTWKDAMQLSPEVHAHEAFIFVASVSRAILLQETTTLRTGLINPDSRDLQR